MLRQPTSRISVLAWALYDLGNTAFALNIISLHFALWVVNDMGGSDSHYGYANIMSMVLVLLTGPILGAMSDQTNRRMPFLIIMTCLCVFFTVLLGLGGLHASLPGFLGMRISRYFGKWVPYFGHFYNTEGSESLDTSKARR